MSEMEISPLYINPDDTRETVEALIRKSDSDKLLLILAGHTGSNIDIIDLQLLQRQVQRSEKQLAIATRNAKLSDAADHLGIPHFRTPSHARRADWTQKSDSNLIRPVENQIDGRNKPQPYKPRIHPHQWWEWALLGASIILICMIGLLFFSRATITLEVIPQTQSLPLDVTASKTVRAATLAGEIPIHTSAIILEATGSETTSGIVSFPEGYASGALTVTNLTNEDLDLPAGLTVQTVDVNPVQFTINQAVRLSPAGEEEDTVKVEITAKAPGREGNVTPGEILAVVGEYGASIAVRNAGAMFGGYNRHVNSPADTDISSLRHSLTKDLLAQAQNAYADQMEADGFTLLPDTIRVDEILSEEVVPLKDEPADEFHLTLRVRFTADYLDPSDLEQTAAQLLDATLEDGYTANIENNIEITPVSAPIAKDAENYYWPILLHRQIIPDLSLLELDNFTSQSHRKLETWLEENFSHIETIKITAQPRFWWWLPVFPQRMEVIVI